MIACRIQFSVEVPYMARVVSLIASATEMVYALGCGEHLVGRSHECDYPEAVQRLPVCTEPKFPTDGASREIDQHVHSLVQEGLSVYRVHEDVLRQLRPDIVLTQVHCEVCAVSQRDVEAAVASWLGSRPIIVSLAPNNLADVWRDIGAVARALGVPAQGDELVERLRQRVEAIAAQAQSQPHRPTVACIEWIDPLMAAGNWVPELVALAGGDDCFGVAGRHAPDLTWEQLCERDPEAIVLMPCGFGIDRTRQEMGLLEKQPGWGRLRAVRTGRVLVTDGNQYFNRPGPRLVESVEILAEILHPGACRFGHEGAGWCRWLSER
jgi:iron complex transport system substrate-binding protein